MGEAKNKTKNQAPAAVVKHKKIPGGKSTDQTLRQAYAIAATAAWIPALAAKFQGNVEALKTVAKDAALLGLFTADELIAREAVE